MTVPVGLPAFSPPQRRRRLALYSHDTQGLGHVRRNLAIAWSLARTQPPPDTLLICGAREARSFPLPPSTDCLTLPGLHKDADGHYRAGRLSASLDELADLRAHTIHAALRAFRPDVLIVDKVARGAFGELEPALEALRRGGRTRIVLGLRDVLDDPEHARAEWWATATTEALTDLYDAVWVYGDPAVYDPVVEYDLGDVVARMVRYTGYLAPPPARGLDQAGGLHGLAGRAYALCLVGGGQDGRALAEAFLRAHLPRGITGVVVTGPYMAAADRAALEALAERRPARRVLGFVKDCLVLARHARSVVAMGGYNTTVELLATRRPALLVPRVRPRREQLVRAERLAERGLLDVLHPDLLSPDALSRWLAGTRTRSTGRRRQGIDLAGLDRLPALFHELVTGSPTERRVRCRVVT